MLHQAATVNSSLSIGDAIKRLETYPDETWVVVRRREGEHLYWYHRQIGELRYLAENSSNWPDQLGTPLKIVLDLHEHTASRTIEVNEVSVEDLPRKDGVLLDGETVVGVLLSEPEPAASGSEPGDHEMARGMPRDMPRDMPGDISRGMPKSAPLSVSRGMPSAPGDISRGIPMSAGPGLEDSPAVDESPFEAYPVLDAPNGVQTGQPFELKVSLTSEQLAAVNAGPIVIDSAPSEEFDLLVQVIAPGFRALAGTQRFLHVNRDALEVNEVTFKLLAVDESLGQPKRHSLEIQFSFNGETCGRAWRDITVVPEGMTAGDAPPAETGSSPVSAPGGSNAPDLTISITEADEDGHFVWLFTSPHQVNLFPDEQVESRLNDNNARSFANHVLKGIPGKDGTDQVGMHMTGTSRQVADNMPNEFWLVLGEVWSLVHAEVRVPRLLFLSAEPYVPWELASVEDVYIDPALLDPEYTKVLNAQTRVGRWLPPRPRTPRGGDKPAQPPAVKVGIKQIAVITGDYLATNGIRPLPEAEEEGDELTERYQALRLKAIWQDIKKLLQNQVEKDGQQVDIELMHFACHGKVDTTNPLHNGIVLNERNMRLDPTTARGNSIGSATQPFAFMNACEVGMAGETLGSYGGMAAALLNEGFRGFVAPLWAVNDKVAHSAALKFYEKTLVDKEPVSEALRAVRRDYDPDAAEPSASTLAYIFYGHPDLVLER